MGTPLGGAQTTPNHNWTVGQGLHVDTDVSGTSAHCGPQELRAPTMGRSSWAVPRVALRALLDFSSTRGALPL